VIAQTNNPAYLEFVVFHEPDALNIRVEHIHRQPLQTCLSTERASERQRGVGGGRRRRKIERKEKRKKKERVRGWVGGQEREIDKKKTEMTKKTTKKNKKESRKRRKKGKRCAKSRETGYGCIQFFSFSTNKDEGGMRQC
jgi:hypothetical protein